MSAPSSRVNYTSESEIPNETPFIPNSSIPPMPSRNNPIHIRNNNRLKKMYLKDDHVYLSDSDFSDSEEDIEFPYNTHQSKHHKNGIMDNIIGKKKVVTFIMPKKDAKVLRRAKKYAKRLDCGISVGAGIKLPLDPIIGIIPGIGDIAGIVTGLGLVGIAQKAGLCKKVYSKMIGNLIVDTAVGFIPAFGDIADFFHKANMKNYKILEKYLIKRSKAFTRMINGEMRPEAFYNKYKSFAPRHKKDIMFIHENLGIPLPQDLATKLNPPSPVPSFLNNEEELEEIENTNGLVIVSENDGPQSKPGVIVTNINTSDNEPITEINIQRNKK